MKELRFTIPVTLPGLNEYQKACRSKSWVLGAKMKKEAQRICMWGMIKLKGQHLDACHVFIKWIEPNRKRDLDNICFAKKFIFDALQEMGIIDNDGWEQIRSIREDFDVDKDNPRVEVTLTEAETLTQSKKLQEATHEQEEKTDGQ